MTAFRSVSILSRALQQGQRSSKSITTIVPPGRTSKVQGRRFRSWTFDLRGSTFDQPKLPALLFPSFSSLPLVRPPLVYLRRQHPIQATCLPHLGSDRRGHVLIEQP